MDEELTPADYLDFEGGPRFVPANHIELWALFANSP